MKLINLRPASDDDVHCRAGRVLPFLPTGGRSSLMVSGRVGRQSAQMTMEVLQGRIFSQARVVMGLSVQFSALSCKLTSAPLIILPKSEILIVLPAEMYFFYLLLFIYYLPLMMSTPPEIKFGALKILLLQQYLFIYFLE